MGAVEPAGTVQGHELSSADHAQAILNILEDSHDLRSPLRALSGYGEILTEDYGDSLGETGRGYVARIQAASQRMDTLIDDLLALSRVSRAEMSLGPVNLSAEVTAIAGELQPASPAAGSASPSRTASG